MLLTLLACTPGDKLPADDSATTPGPLAVEVSVAEVQTVLVVKWATDDPTTGVVTATFDGGELTRTESQPGQYHELMLVGLPAETVVEVQVEAVDSDGAVLVGEAAATTGALPSWVPEVVYAADAPELAEGGVTILPLIAEQGGAIVALDEAARVVWYWPTTGTLLDRMPFRARLALDGKAVLYSTAAPDIDADAEVVRVPLAGGATSFTPVPTGHTDFVEYTPGGYVMIGWDARYFGDRGILGDQLVEVAPDGGTRVIWNIFDWFEPDLTQTWPEFFGQTEGLEDWSHLNGLAYDPDGDALYVSATFLNGVLKVDRPSGDLVWTASEFAGGDFATGGRPLMTLPHSVQPIDGGLLVFSRGMGGDQCSEAVDIALDESAWTAARSWAHADPDCLQVNYLGSAERLPGGNTLVGWSTENRVDEVTAEGVITWSATLDFGIAVGFVERVQMFGPE